MMPFMRPEVRTASSVRWPQEHGGEFTFMNGRTAYIVHERNITELRSTTRSQPTKDLSIQRPFLWDDDPFPRLILEVLDNKLKKLGSSKIGVLCASTWVP